jgi:hypothetical protein
MMNFLNHCLVLFGRFAHCQALCIHRNTEVCGTPVPRARGFAGTLQPCCDCYGINPKQVHVLSTVIVRTVRRTPTQPSIGFPPGQSGPGTWNCTMTYAAASHADRKHVYQRIVPGFFAVINLALCESGAEAWQHTQLQSADCQMPTTPLSLRKGSVCSVQCPSRCSFHHNPCVQTYWRASISMAI